MSTTLWYLYACDRQLFDGMLRWRTRGMMLLNMSTGYSSILRHSYSFSSVLESKKLSTLLATLMSS